MKKNIKKFLGFVFGNEAIFDILKCLNKNKLVILYYHRVIEKELMKEVNYKNMCIGPSSFEEQMRFLKEHCNPISENDVISIMKREKTLPQFPVWMTFDDGYKDNYINAYPILKKYKIPATFFVTTGFINRQIVPPEGYAAKNDIANLFMSWEEVKEMADNGFDIGAHTVSHKILSSLDKESVEKEISESKYEIERMVGKKVFSFAYPKGRRSDYNLITCSAILRNYDFKLAVTTLGGYNNLNAKKNYFNLKRIGFCDDDTLNFFKFKLSTGSFWQT